MPRGFERRYNEGIGRSATVTLLDPLAVETELRPQSGAKRVSIALPRDRNAERIHASPRGWR
jgi:hypothetical protein